MKSPLNLIMLFFLLIVCSSNLSAQPSITKTDVPAERGFHTKALVEGLIHPWGMAWLPNGDLLITERSGSLRLVRGNKLVSAPVAGVAEVFTAGQGGLLDVSLHPRFKENHKLYFTYAHGNTIANRTRIATAVYENNVLKDWKVIFEVSTAKMGTQHFGSRLLWLPDETLLVSIGDGGNPPVRLAGDWIRKQAQNKRSHLGKILRLNQDGTIPRDNPFFDSTNAAPAVWSFGHRNIQGLAFDPLREMVWASEHGALGGDEVNVVWAGKNYGWPAVTYSREYFDGSKISPHTSKEGISDPKVVWTNAIAPSGLTVYTGYRFAHWHGDLFAGGLRSQDIRRIDLDQTGNVIGQYVLRIGQRVRDIRQGPDEMLYVLTDESDGRLLRLEPADEKNMPEAP